MSLRFQRLILILLSFILLLGSILLILFNTKKNIVFFYTPTELIEGLIKTNQKIRVGGLIKENTLKKISAKSYKFKITDGVNSIDISYTGILPDLFGEGQGAVIEGIIKKNNTINAKNVYAKHDENYMPASIKKELKKNYQWQKNYK